MRWLIAVLLFIAVVKPVLAGQPEEDPFANIESIDTSEVSVTVVEPEADSLLTVIGKFHPLVLHFPIAWLALWLLMEMVGLFHPASVYYSARPPLAALTLLSFLPAIITGLLRAQSVEEIDPVITSHRNLEIIGAGLVFCAAGISRMSKLKPLMVLVLVAAMLVVAFGAHLGGQLVYGDDYLPF